MPGMRGKHRNQRSWIMLRHLNAALEVGPGAGAICFRHHQLVFEDDVVEASAFEVFGEFDEKIRGWAATSRCERLVPFVLHEVGEPRQMKLSPRHGPFLSLWTSMDDATLAGRVSLNAVDHPLATAEIPLCAA